MPPVPLLPTSINGRWSILLPEHRAVRPQWATGWERERLDSMHANIVPGDVVFDIGAEEGDMPALYASWGADVVLVEPNPLVWPNIRTIFDANDLTSHVIGWFVGFASNASLARPPEYDPSVADDINGWPRCSYGPVIGDHGFRQLAERPHDTPQITIDDLAVLTRPPDVITIDVEGSEYHVLRGANATLRYSRPLVYVSVHPTFMEETYGTHAGVLFDYMRTLGYESVHLATDHEEHWVFVPEGRSFVEGRLLIQGRD